MSNLTLLKTVCCFWFFSVVGTEDSRRFYRASRVLVTVEGVALPSPLVALWLLAVHRFETVCRRDVHHHKLGRDSAVWLRLWRWLPLSRCERPLQEDTLSSLCASFECEGSFSFVTTSKWICEVCVTLRRSVAADFNPSRQKASLSLRCHRVPAPELL